MGTREHIMAHLAEVGELSDDNGMASTQLAAAVGYPGSSVAFAQLLSGMERSGLIEREVRGKRTYRIGLGPARTARAAAAARHSGLSGATPVSAAAEGLGLAGFDYDELARRLLVQVARHITESEPEDLATSEPKGRGVAWTEERGTSDEGRQRLKGGPEASDLVKENVRLREQLRDAQRSLTEAAERVRRLPVTSDPASNEVALLQRLLLPYVDVEVGA